MLEGEGGRIEVSGINRNVDTEERGGRREGGEVIVVRCMKS